MRVSRPVLVVIVAVTVAVSHGGCTRVEQPTGEGECADDGACVELANLEDVVGMKLLEARGKLNGFSISKHQGRFAGPSDFQGSAPRSKGWRAP
jgi:hypothetical protein